MGKWENNPFREPFERGDQKKRGMWGRSDAHGCALGFADLAREEDKGGGRGGRWGSVKSEGPPNRDVHQWEGPFISEKKKKKRKKVNREAKGVNTLDGGWGARVGSLRRKKSRPSTSLSNNGGGG